MRLEDLEEQPRRRRWTWAVLALVLLIALAAVFWRWLPPGDATMAQVRAAEVAYESVFAPATPEEAVAGEPLTGPQLAALETELQTRLEACCTAEFLATQGRYARSMARKVSTALANGSRYEPTHPYEYLRDLQFRRRLWNGDLVFDVYTPGQTRLAGLPVPETAFVTETIRFTRAGDVWKIADVQHFGG